MRGAVLGVWRLRLFKNPVIKRELIERLRKPSSFVYLSLFLIILLFFMLTSWSDFLQSRYAGYQARHIFYIFTLLQAGILLFLIPILSATSINIEFERNSWDLLRTTHLSSAGIVFAKLSSSIFYILLFFIALIPFYSILLIMGSVGPMEIFLVYLMMLEGILICGLLGLLSSILFRKPVQAISGAYFFLACYLLGPTLLSVYFINKFHSPFLYGLPIISSPFYPIMVHLNPNPPGRQEVSPTLHAMYAEIHATTTLLTIIGIYLLCLYLIHRRMDKRLGSRKLNFIRSYGFRTYYRKQNLSVDHETLSIPEKMNPIYHKEKSEQEANYRLSNYAYTAILFITSFLFLLNDYNNPYDRYLDEIVYWPVFLTPIFVLPYAVNAFRNEKDRCTWDLLQTTLLTPMQIVWGKLREGMRLFLWRFIAFFGLASILACITFLDLQPRLIQRILYTARNDFDLMLIVFILSFAWAFFCLSWGMYFSSSSKNTLTAYTKSVLLVLALLLGPYLIYLQNGFEDRFYPLYNLLVRDFSTCVSPLLLIENYFHWEKLLGRAPAAPPRILQWMLFSFIQIMIWTLTAIIALLLTRKRIRELDC